MGCFQHDDAACKRSTDKFQDRLAFNISCFPNTQIYNCRRYLSTFWVIIKSIRPALSNVAKAVWAADGCAAVNRIHPA